MARNTNTQRRKLRRRPCETNSEDWIQWLKEIENPLLVPGQWWENEQRKTKKFACKIVDVEYNSNRYEFSIVCVNEEHAMDSEGEGPYVMLLPDIQRYVLVLQLLV